MTDTAQQSRTYIGITEANNEELLGKRFKAHIILAAYVESSGQFVDSAGSATDILLMTGTFWKEVLRSFRSEKERPFAKAILADLLADLDKAPKEAA